MNALNRLIALFFFVSLSVLQTLGQISCFNADVVDGCVPLTIKIMNCGGPALCYDYHETSTPNCVDSLSHTYKTVGIFNVSQRGNFSINGGLPTLTDVTKENYIKVRSVQVPKLTSFPCANRSVQVVANDPQYDLYFVKANGKEDTVPQAQSRVIALADPVPPSLEVQGGYKGLCRGNKTNLPITTYASLILPKVFSLSVLNEQQLELAFQAERYHRYEISLRAESSTVFQKLDTLEGLEGFFKYIIPNLSTSNASYCVQIKAIDYCGQRTSPVEACSIVLSGNPVNQQNEIKWTAYPIDSLSGDYILSTNGQNTNSLTKNVTSFTDTAVICGQEYRYQIRATLVNGAVSNSNVLSLKAISTSIPPTVQDLTSSVVGGKVQLSWQASPANPLAYSIYTTSNTLIGTSSTSTFVDQSSDPSNAQYCYKVGYVDRCGNPSVPTENTCPVFLTGKVNSALSRSVSWQPYVSWADGLKEYLVEKVTSGGTSYFSLSVGTSTSFSDSLLDTAQQVIYYRVTAVSNSGKTSYSNIWKAEQESKIYFPNAFTPNGDGLNDTFLPVGLFVGDFKMEIWNRNGEGMFSTNSIKEGWDGNVNGQRAPVDTYMYKWEGKDKTGKVFRAFPGTLQLIR